MKGKKASMGFALALMGFFIMIAAVILVTNDGGTITGASVYDPIGYINPACYENGNSCVDLDGDGYVTSADETIFAAILNGNLPYDSKADFDGDLVVNNIFDFQECFVPLRDYYNDIYGGVVGCNVPEGVWNDTNFANCTNGCPDLNGDGWVTDADWLLFKDLMGKDVYEIVYPGADLHEPKDAYIGTKDKDCFRRYYGRVVTCNLPTHFLHTNGCPDLRSDVGIGNDGFVDNFDKYWFDIYFAQGSTKVDFNGDGSVSWIDKLIFDEYYKYYEQDHDHPRVVFCNLYHAAWHVGGMNQQNVMKNGTNSALFGGSTRLSQSFEANCLYTDQSNECQLTKIRLHLKNETSNIPPIYVELYWKNITSGAPNETYLISTASITPSFELNRSSWVTIPFKSPPTLKSGEIYHLVVSSPNETANDFYRWYYNEVEARNISISNYSITGENKQNGHFGKVVATGDINNDGYEDIVVGAPEFNASNKEEGKVYLFYGPIRGTPTPLTANASWYGSYEDHLGYSLAIGDIDKDNYDDIIIGATNVDGTGNNLGAVYVVYGDAIGGLNQNISTVSVLTRWFGESSDDKVGYSVASGDVNNDGYDDIITGARSNDASGNSAGAIYVVLGPNFVTNGNLSDANIKIYGENAINQLGESLATGDINSDGYSDIVIGTIYESTAYNNAGAVYVVYGDELISGETYDVGDVANAKLYGEEGGAFAGNAVATGDVNNDGFDDVIAGSISYDGATNQGKVYLFYGPVSGGSMNSSDASWYGTSSNDYLGHSISSGDVDGDSFDDIIVSASGYDNSNDEGGVYIIYGPVRIGINEPISEAAGTTWFGEEVDEYLGGTLSSFENMASLAIADLNKDGFGDAVIGASLYGSNNRGRTYINYGPFPRNVTGSYWNNSGSGWEGNSSRDFLYQLWLSSACADLNRDGLCDSKDDELISQIPDGMRYSGTDGYNPKYDLDGNDRINSADSALLSSYTSSPQFLFDDQSPSDNCSYTSSDVQFGNTKALVQRFTAPATSLHYIELLLKKTIGGSGTKPISVKIWDGLPSDSSAIQLGETEIIPPIPSTAYEWKRVHFDPPADGLVQYATYYIVVSSFNAGTTSSYAWGNCSVSPQNYSTCNVDISANATGTSDDWVCSDASSALNYKVFEGNTPEEEFNETLDLNGDGAINGTDYNLVKNSEGNWSGAWFAKIDFNAIYGVYEALKDYTLGFRAYLEPGPKVLTCGLPTWEDSIYNNRCDYEAPYYETFVTDPLECPPCDYNDFCGSSEDFTYCIDCTWPAEIPLYNTFGCGTTEFFNVSNIGMVEDAVIEDCSWGKIQLLEAANFTALDLDNDIEIDKGYMYFLSPTIDALNKNANLYFYNLTYIHPWIIFDGARCPGSRCNFTSYIRKTGGKKDLKFEVSKIGTGKFWSVSTVDDSGDVGMYNSLEMDRFGRPHIVYYDAGNDSIKYANWYGLNLFYYKSWQSRTIDTNVLENQTSLAFDSKNQPHIVYCNSSGVQYAHFNGFTWMKETINESVTGCSAPAIAIGPNDKIHVVYNDGTDFKYASYEGEEWGNVNIRTGGSAEYSSISVDSSNTPHISYVLASDMELYYATCIVNCTASEDNWYSNANIAGGTIGSPSIAVDKFDDLHASYYDMDNEELEYALCIGNCNVSSNWDSITVDSNGSVGDYSSLAVDASGNPYISYYDKGNETLKYAYCTSNCETNTTRWTKRNVTLADDGKFSSIGLDRFSNIYISYYNSSELKIASYLSQTDYEIIEAAPDMRAFTGHGTTNLSINTGINLLSVPEFTAENQWGKVEWIFPVNISPVDFVRLNISEYLKIVHNNISLAIRYLPTLNRPAQLTFYNISMVYPDLIRNGDYCPATNCQFISYEGRTLVYNVSRFSSYHAVDRAAPYIPSFLIFSFTVLAAFVLSISIVLLKKGDKQQ